VKFQEELDATDAGQPRGQAGGKPLPFKQLYRHRHAGLGLELRTRRLQQVGQAVGILDLQLHDASVLQAMPSRKPKASAFGSINPGDLLTTSSTPGHAMKVSDDAKARFAVLGQALTGLKAGRGWTQVLVGKQ
jgi:hypothetical protein